MGSCPWCFPRMARPWPAEAEHSRVDLAAVGGIRRRPLDNQARSRALESLWAELADEDAAKAYLAGHTLIVGGKDTVTFLQRQLRPVPGLSMSSAFPGCWPTWIATSLPFVTKLAGALEQMGEQAEAALRKALTGQSSPEVHHGVQLYWTSSWREISTPTPERLRVLRAVMVLEQIGSPEARKLLEMLSKGAGRSAADRGSPGRLPRLNP